MGKFFYIFLGVIVLNSAALADTAPRSGAQDFDFLVGRWYGESQRLLHRFQNAKQWVRFSSTHDGRRMVSGLGIEDDFRTDYDFGTDGKPSFIGQSLQIYNPATQRWSVYWVDNRDHTLSPPVVGAFKDGVGVFEGEDTLNGQPIRVRYTWSGISEAAARWEQAFSNDNGNNWETNWIMTFRRAP